MVDEIVSPTSAPAASPDSISAEAVPSVVETPTTPDAPVAEPVVSPSLEKTDVPVVEKSEPETLLGSEKKPEVMVEEKKPNEKISETEIKKENETPTLPVYEAFKLPEGISQDDKKISDFTKALGEFEQNSKAPHEEVQKLGQSLVDRHVAEVKETMDRYTKSLTDAWNKQKNDWKESFLSDPEIGGNRHETVVNSAVDAIGIYGGSEKQQSEFRDLMEKTGVGNHPAMIRLLSNVMIAKAEPKPLAAPMIAKPVQMSKVQKMYGKKAS